MKTKEQIAGKRFTVRQDDVLIQAIKELPKEAKLTKVTESRIILEHGELTGHAHFIQKGQANLYETDEQKFLAVEFGQNPIVMHDEHSSITLPAPTKEGEVNYFAVKRQREYDYANDMERVVRD